MKAAKKKQKNQGSNEKRHGNEQLAMKGKGEGVANNTQ